MHKIKIILLSLIAITAFLVSMIAFILNSYNNQDYQQLLIKIVDNFSGYTLSINGPFVLHRSLTPVLSASKIELQSKTDKSVIRIDNFRIQLALSPLINNTLLINDLLVENMQVKLQPSEESKYSTNFLRYLPVPIVEHAQLKNVKVITGTNNQIHTLNNLIISSKNRQAPLEIQGVGTIKGHLFDIKGQLGPLADIFIHQKPYPVNLVANWKHAQLWINGSIIDPPQGEGLDLVGKLNIPEMADIVAANIPVKGHLQSRIHLKGTFSEPVLVDIQASIINEPLLNLQVTGSLAQEETELHLSGFIHDAELLKWIMPDSSPFFDSLKIETDMIEVNQAYVLQNIDITLSNQHGLKIDLAGNSQLVMQAQPFRAARLQATISSNDTETVNHYLGGFLPEMGPVSGNARITTQGDNFVLSDIDLLAGVNKKVQLIAKGTVGPLSIDPLSDEGKIALDISLKAEHSSDLTSLLDMEHPEIGPIAIIATLSGSFEKLKLGNIKLKAGNPNIVSIQANGWITWDKLSSDFPQQFTDITIQADTPSLQNAARLYSEDSPNLGPAHVSMRIHGKGEVLKGSGLAMKIGTANGLLLTVQGNVAEIVYTDFFYKGIELTGSLASKSTRHLSKLLENSNIPDIGSLSGNFVVRGDSNRLQIPQISLSAGRKNQLLFTASGQIAEIPLRQQVAPRGVDIGLTVTAPNSAELSSIVRNEIPDLGRLLIKGRLVDDKKGIFSVKELTLTAGNPEKPIISMSGSVDDVLSAHSLQMKILFDEKTLVKLLNLQPIPELGQLRGSAFLSNASGAFSIKDLKIESGNSELISFKIIGAIENVTKTDQITANVDITIKQPELFGQLFAIDLSGLGPVSASGIINGNKESVTYKGHSFIGKTKLTSDLSLSFINDKAKISGEISSPNIFLEDLGMVTRVSTTSQSGPPGPIKKVLFSEAPLPLNFLHQVDLDMKLRLFKMTGIDYELDRVTIDLLIQNGQLTVNPIGFDFADGHITMQAKINARKIPEWLLSIEGNNMQLGEPFRKLNKIPPVEGDLNFIVALKSSGRSVHEIAANLGGGFGFTLENGGVSRSQLELVFLNPLGWLFSHGINGHEFRISCGLGRYQVKQGIVRSKVFLIDGPKLLVRGKTKINLGNETIHSLYNLEKKNFLDNTIIPTFSSTSVPIKISGNLFDPSIEEVSIPSVISNADRYIFAPIVAIPQELLGTVFELFEESKEEQSPCAAYLKN